MAIDAIIFDLDDTLVDTSGELILPAHQEAAAAMIAAGLQGTLEEVTQRRLALAAAEPGTSVDVRMTAFFRSADPEAVVRAGHDAFYGRKVARLSAMDGIHDVLEVLGARHRLFLVTIGHPDTQRTKVELAGLGRHFEAVVLVDIRTETKHDAFAALLQERGLSPASVVAVGDSVEREIAAARRLGMWAVRVLHGEGEGRRIESPAWQPHYSVPGVHAVPAVLEDIEADGGTPPPLGFGA